MILEPRQAKVKRIQYHQTSFITNVKGTYIVKNAREAKDLQNQPQTIKKKVTIGRYISIITLNVNGLNVPKKKLGWLNGYKNKIHMYAVYKKPTSDLKTHID